MPRPARRTDLSHDAICAAALRLIDRHGLAAFSTRKLGAVLGCEAMAIYWYYPSKDALLDAVIDRLIGNLPTSGQPVQAQPTDWVAALRAIAYGYRRIAHEHPNAFPLLTTRRFASEGSYQFLEQLFALARGQGLDDRTIARFYRIVSSYCNGFALDELAPPLPKNATLRKRHPRVVAVMKWLEPRYLDDVFELGLEIQLAALTAHAS
ncbi:MAG TPA: TetR/AcrR family transcriptional regulator [Kofleriaceae bacterium]